MHSVQEPAGLCSHPVTGLHVHIAQVICNPAIYGLWFATVSDSMGSWQGRPRSDRCNSARRLFISDTSSQGESYDLDAGRHACRVLVRLVTGSEPVGKEAGAILAA